jgi:nucleotide-binding universal stress UspA family protein/quercetin dioxygenase-like cupin family protein
MAAIQTILHPTDFTPESDYAFRMACTLAKDYHARLVLLHVMLPSVSPLASATPNPLETAEAQDGLRERFPWPEPGDPGIKIEHRVAEGDSADEVVRLARSLGCDLIVMGTHGRSGLDRWLTGSVAETVLRQAPCPVMTIRTGESAHTPAAPTARPPARPGEIVNFRPLGPALEATPTEKLIAAASLQVTRLILPAGKEIFDFKNKGTTVVHCLEGRVQVTLMGKTQLLEAGQLLYMGKDEPHTFAAVENAALLLTTAV